jgi:uncharacterized membrane protein YedE/YeeE
MGNVGMSWQFAHPFVQAALGGVLIGLASWLLLASLGRIAGISGIAASALVPAKHAAEGETTWRWAFIVGLVGVGALASNFMHVPVMAPCWARAAPAGMACAAWGGARRARWRQH